jgi:hypothetical protein
VQPALAGRAGEATGQGEQTTPEGLGHHQPGAAKPDGGHPAQQVVGQGSDDRLLLILSVIVLAMPARFEGPILVTITQRHRVTLSDVVGFIPLSVGWLAWVVAIWRRRWRVEAAISASHGRPPTVPSWAGLASGS